MASNADDQPLLLRSRAPSIWILRMLNQNPDLARRIVYVVDDDRDVRMSLGALLQSAGISVRPFAGADDFLSELPYLKPGCVIVDLRMPEKNGLTLLKELQEMKVSWPAIMITGHGEITAAVSAMKAGAREFLQKPFEHVALFQALDRGFADLLGTIEVDSLRNEAWRRFSQLTPRQRQVLERVLAGDSSKQIAAQLKLSPRTVEMHRAAMMRCLGVKDMRELLALFPSNGGYRLTH